MDFRASTELSPGHAGDYARPEGHPDGVSTGEYGGSDLASHFTWAAAELYVTTGKPDYWNDFEEEAIAKSYLDDWGSYSTHEVTINWNAPLVYVSGALQALEGQE